MKKITIRLPDQLYFRVVALANQERRSMQQQVVLELDKATRGLQIATLAYLVAKDRKAKESSDEDSR